MNASTRVLLNEYYQNRTQGLTLKQNIKSEWDHMNKWGFFLGIIEHGNAEHVSELNSLLITNEFDNQHTFSSPGESATTFIDRMFAYYILPFHKSYSDASVCNTPVSSVVGLNNLTNENDMPTHYQLKKGLESRDKICMFCWIQLSLQAAHIIAQKRTFVDTDIFERTELRSKDQVQNGLLLCILCHNEFDKLKRYVDVDVNDKLVLKVVNFSNVGGDEKQVEYARSVENLVALRNVNAKYFPDGRRPIESNNEMALYFRNADPTLQPSREALKWHKTACLIWRMAGGAESDEEYCSDEDFDDFIPVNNRARISSIENWLNSNESLKNAENEVLCDRENALNTRELHEGNRTYQD